LYNRLFGYALLNDFKSLFRIAKTLINARVKKEYLSMKSAPEESGKPNNAEEEDERLKKKEAKAREEDLEDHQRRSRKETTSLNKIKKVDQHPAPMSLNRRLRRSRKEIAPSIVGIKSKNFLAPTHDEKGRVTDLPKPKLAESTLLQSRQRDWKPKAMGVLNRKNRTNLLE
jgi:hypothetical protein